MKIPPLLTAGELARRLKRSRYGVKKALHRLKIQPALIMAGISFYPEQALTTLAATMRQPNLLP